MIRLAALLLVVVLLCPAQAASSGWAEGVGWYQKGRYGRAVEVFAARVRRDPLDAVAWMWLGASAYRAGRWDLALRAFSHAARLRPRDPAVRVWLGYVFLARGDRALAVRALWKAASWDPWGRAGGYARWALRALSGRFRVARSVDPAAYAALAQRYNPRLDPQEAFRIGSALVAYARHFNVDPRLVAALIVVESGFNPRAVSPAGAMGLGQLMPTTARRAGVRAPFDPVENLYGTVRVLRGHLDRYGYHNLPLALAAYNAGRGAVARYGGIPPYAETQWYVYNVLSLYRRAIDGDGP